MMSEDYKDRVFEHTDEEGDSVSLWLRYRSGGLRVSVDQCDARSSAYMDYKSARALRDALTDWLGEGAPASLTPADVRAIAIRAAAEVIALHQSPQARYEDAVAARLCTIPGCPAFPGTSEHFEHGELTGNDICRGGYGCETSAPHVKYSPGCGALDPEPHDVGHPEPAPCPLVQPLRARPDDRCGDCGGTWRDHRMPFCTDYGTLTLETFPKCPRCGGDWPSDNRHIDDGHCPGRPEGCTCRHDISAHREPHGCMPRGEGCGCKYGKRPTDWSGGVYSR